MRPTSRADDGFTLVEVLIAGVVGSIIIGAVAATFMVALRTTEGTFNRMSVTFDAQLVSNYLLPDVQSAGTGASDLTSPGGSCNTRTPDGTAVLSAAWRETQAQPSGPAATTTYDSVYRVTSNRQLVRTHRVNGSTTSTDVLARSVKWADAQISGDRVNLCVRVEHVDPNTGEVTSYGATVTGFRRSSSEVSTGGGPPTTAPPPCVVDTATVEPNPANRSTLGVLFGTAPRLTVTTSGPSCANVRVVYETSAGSPPLVPPVVVDTLLTRSGDTWQTDLVTAGWDDRGEFELALFWSDTPTSVRNPLGTVDFHVETSEPCLVTSLVANPTAGTRDRNPDPQVLTQGSVTVTANANATCPALTLRYDPTSTAANPTAKTLAFTNTTGTTWQAEIPSTELWSDGQHPLQVWEGAGSALGLTALNSVDFNVTPRPCEVTRVSAEPNPVGWNSGNGSLKSDVTLTVEIRGVCSAFQARYTPENTAVTVTLTEDQTSFAKWTYVIRSNAHKWSEGNKKIEFVQSGASVGEATLTVKK